MKQSGLLRGGIRGAPCLIVGDIRRATVYYRDILGFAEVEMLGNPATAAVVRRVGAAVLLQQATTVAADYSHRRFADQAWDALFFVNDIERTAADLRERGATIQVGLGRSKVSRRTLEVRDEWGNVLAFAEARIGLGPAATPAARRLVPIRLSAAVRQHRRDREERLHLREFQAFHDGMRDRRDPFYMFFTQGLLHWVYHAERHVPRDVNLVLVGSALPAEEQRWLRDHMDRPFHNIRLGVDDNTTWEFLFAVNRRNFGYLDIDCFVLQPSLFQEMARITPDVAVNGIWTYDAVPGVPIACTHFVFINMLVADELRQRKQFMSPTNYDWWGSNVSLLHPRTNCRIPTAGQRRLLLQIMPPDDRGRPRTPGGGPFFDTLVAYQLAARASGFTTHPVRRLAHRTQLSLDETTGAGEVWQQDMSDEVVHVGGVSYYHRRFHSPRLRGMYLAAEYSMLQGIRDLLPDPYGRRLRWLATELAHLGLTPESAPNLVEHHLIADRGLSRQAAALVLGRTAQPSH